MQFQVPQYIDVQEKIVGPLTLKQFGYLAAAGIVSFLTYFAGLIIWIVASIFAFVIAGALAFLKINGQTLPVIIISAVQYFLRPRLYLWQRKPIEREIILPEEKTLAKEGLGGEGRLKNLGEKLMTMKLPIPRREKGQLVLGEKKEAFVKIRKATGEQEVARKIDYK